VENGNLATAKYVCIQWITAGTRVNLGYDPDVEESFDAAEYPHNAYNDQGVVETHKGKGVTTSVYAYGDGKYGAILFFS
jgi:hypothetical protein